MKYRVKEKITKVGSTFYIEKKILGLFWVDLNFWLEDQNYCFDSLEKAKQKIDSFIENKKDNKIIKKVTYFYNEIKKL